MGPLASLPGASHSNTNRGPDILAHLCRFLRFYTRVLLHSPKLRPSRIAVVERLIFVTVSVYRFYLTPVLRNIVKLSPVHESYLHHINRERSLHCSRFNRYDGIVTFIASKESQASSRQ